MSLWPISFLFPFRESKSLYLQLHVTINFHPQYFAHGWNLFPLIINSREIKELNNPLHLFRYSIFSPCFQSPFSVLNVDEGLSSYPRNDSVLDIFYKYSNKFSLKVQGNYPRALYEFHFPTTERPFLISRIYQFPNIYCKIYLSFCIEHWNGFHICSSFMLKFLLQWVEVHL